MDHISEYNVGGGLLGLGPDILLEILSEITHLDDVRQFLILCKKIFKLQTHQRFLKMIQQTFQIAKQFIFKKGIEGRVDKNKFIHSKNDDWCTIAVNPIINEGIASIEIIFNNTGYMGRCIGIADASCSFAAGKGPWEAGNQEKTVRYWDDGYIDHITKGIDGNQSYKDGQRIAVEVDMTIVPRRATFFVEGVEQSNCVIGIPEAIRFWACIFNSFSSFNVSKFERLIKSSAKGEAGSKGLEYGKEWK
ncbi:MAG: hypothetical protein EZS28_019727 [Streblomastix strix]|uniref:Uncharacterized protein n=1 Tax=Streblomastix strix TaxID=222440 RepID=A0A5J4VQ11_9EUKA|nr:MAG: hypothetical protein EZS28_019727 [Streblomastix strix]